MNIAIVVNSLGAGGAENAARNYIQQLSKDHNVFVYLLHYENRFEFNDNVEIVSLGSQNYGNLKNILLLPILAKRLNKKLLNHKIDVCFSLLERSNFVNCIAKIMGFRGRTIISLHGSMVNFYARNSLKGRVGRQLIKRLYPYADLILPCSAWLIHEFRTEFQVQNDQFETMYNPLNTEEIDKKLEGIDKIKDNIFRFIHVGSFYQVKNHRLLLEAFAKSMKSKNAKLVLLGSGELESDIVNWISELGLEKQVDLVGFTHNPFEHMMQADAMVLSSNTEGLPNVLLEGMYCKLPIISTDCRSGPREIMAPYSDIYGQVTDKLEITPNGILVPVKNVELLAEAMTTMFENKQMHAEMSAHVQEEVKRFYLPKILNELKSHLTGTRL